MSERSNVTPMGQEWYTNQLSKALETVDIDLSQEESEYRIYIVPQNAENKIEKKRNREWEPDLDIQKDAYPLVYRTDLEDVTYSREDRVNAIIDSLREGSRVYVFEPGGAMPHELTGDILNAKFKVGEEIHKPVMPEKPKSLNPFVRFVHWLTNNRAFQEKYDAYQSQKREYEEKLETYNSQLETYTTATGPLRGLNSRFRNNQLEKKALNERREAQLQKEELAKGTPVTADELSGKAPEQLNKSRVSTQSKTKSMEMKAPNN